MHSDFKGSLNTHFCHGLLAKLHFNNSPEENITVLESFFPNALETAAIPVAVPAGIVNEFREAELCLSFSALRAASALLRSVLEKTLSANGYTRKADGDLYKRIEAAAADGVITEPRKRKAHSDVRVLGNDVLHDDWRQVQRNEVEEAHRYTHRILEDLYDDRVTVEAILKAKGRVPKTP